MTRHISALSRLRPLAVLGIFYLITSFLLRMILWGSFGTDVGVTLNELLVALAIGVVSDLVELVYLFGPCVFFVLLISERFYQGRVMTVLGRVATFLTVFGIIYLSFVEYFFFEEFNSRFNLVSVDYLLYPHEVFVNLWESYPIAWYLSGSLIVSYCIYRLLRRYTVNTRDSLYSSPQGLPLKIRMLPIACYSILLGLLVFSRNSDLITFSENRVANEIGRNGIGSFFCALRTEELDYEAFYATLPNQEAFTVLRTNLGKYGSDKFEQVDSIQRTFPARPEGLGKKNVIIVAEESFGAGFVGSYGDSRGLTPHFDALAKRSLLFKNAFATGTRTVRGLEAIAVSFPPIPSESILKRPGNENIATIGQVFKSHGYHTSFLYGGFGMFDNMNHFFGSNGFELSDRTDIKNVTFSNIWGVCDEDLFHHALDYYDKVAQTGQPFFSIIMSTSNHKPYTFPEGIPGIPSRGGGRDAGVKYADYALGKLFEAAPAHEWYKDTIFIVVADHDARVYGREQVPLERYRIPMLIFSPNHVTPGEVTTSTSQIDIAPTILGMLGLPYSAPFYGRDVLRAPAGESPPILLSHNHDVALYQDNKLLVLGLNKSADLYQVDPITFEQKVIPMEEDYRERAIAYYQTAFELFENHHYE